MNEKDWQSRVTEYATLRGWTWAHFRPAQNKNGVWRTAMAGTPGYPDLTLVRDRVIFVELKTDVGRMKPTQVDWLTKLRSAGAEAYVLRPSDWDQVQELLR